MLEELVKKAKRDNKPVYVYAHVNPDADAIGSALSIVEYLRNNGVVAYYVTDENLKPNVRIGGLNERRAYKKGNKIVTRKGGYNYCDVVKKLSLNPNKYFIVKTNKGETIINKEYLEKAASNKTLMNANYIEENIICEDIRESLAVIVDTSTKDYTLAFPEGMNPEDIIIIDHHDKAGDKPLIEEEIGCPNIDRRSNYSSACEIVARLIPDKDMTYFIAEHLVFGLSADTDKLKYINTETIDNLIALSKYCPDYQKFFQKFKKNILTDVPFSKALLEDVKVIQLGEMLGLMLIIDREKLNKLGVRIFQKTVTNLQNIDNICFVGVAAENTKGEYECEFRTDKVWGDLDSMLFIKELGVGGGHRNASGCTLIGTKDEVETTLLTTLDSIYHDTKLPDNIILTDADFKIRDILEYTDKLSTNLTIEILRELSILLKQDNHYSFLIETFKSLEDVMIKAELVSRVKNNLTISFNDDELFVIMTKYNITELELANKINLLAEYKDRPIMLCLPNFIATIDSSEIVITETSQMKKGY